VTRVRWLAVVIAAAVLGALGPDDRPRGPVDRDSCAECHEDVMQHAEVHGPVAVNACDACHVVESAEEHTYTLARTGAELCTFCHELNRAGAAVVHRPVAKGECTACHDPHGGSERSLLVAPTVAALCSECHDDVVDGSHVHGPVAAGACVVCHAPHAAPYPKLLVAEGSALCTNCHATTQTQLESLRVVHPPAAEACEQCHDAHASDHAMMLVAEPQELCLSCHEPIKDTIEHAPTQHAAVTTGQSCLNCHSPHASDYPRVLKTDMETLCFACHDREIELEDGTKLPDIKAVIDTGRSLHGPVAQDNCAACHVIHGGDHFRLLKKEYPPDFYASFSEERYALCFMCHDRQLLQDARTTTLTDFRNGDRNLHYLHVNREKKGRTCRACHATHASNRANHIRESVPFGRGGWMLPIGFEKLENGGRCAPGCHAPYEYNRLDPVVYPPGERPALWPSATGPDPDETKSPGEVP
jgi:predicted CXXCH cytochrome family protein